MSAEKEATIAVIGGGLIGVMVALGLLHRGFQVILYERAPKLFEIGAALAFTGKARECMAILDPRILTALSRVGEANLHPLNRYWDGFTPSTKEAAASEDTSLLFSHSASALDYWGCLRSLLLRELAAELPGGEKGGIIEFGKQLESYDEIVDKVVLRFTDGTTAEADAVIGCDGIHSRTRQLLLGSDNPASNATFSHKVVYRALIPIANGVRALGEDKANNQCAHMGPDANIVSFPVARWTLLNVFIFLHAPEPWPDAAKMVMQSSRIEIEHALKDWSPAIRNLVSLFPEEVTKWGIFHTADYPAPTYANGRVCLAGDAAHAMTPFLGIGASIGVEDALVLAEALGTAMGHKTTAKSKADAIMGAFQAYNSIRLDRTQWVAQNSRDMGDLFQWRYPNIERDSDKIRTEFERKTEVILDLDVEKLVSETKKKTENLLEVVRVVATAGRTLA